MNINQRISELGAGGLPRYNRKVNELIEAVNWLMGMRSDSGIPISEGGRGPVIPGGTAATAAAATPWATDPDGDPAGWVKIYGIDLDGSVTGTTNALYRSWAWLGKPSSIYTSPIPWMSDPANNQAGWIVCPNNAFWGTGQCSGGTMCTNHQSANTVKINDTNPQIWTSNPLTPPITPPTSCTPRFYLNAGPYNPNDQSKPFLAIANGLTTGDPSSAPFNFTYTATYDGIQFFTFSASGTAIWGKETYFPLPTAGWLFDPANYPGYTQGNLDWIYPFNGAVSTSTNPTIVQSFSYTFMRWMQANLFNVLYLTA